jgi:putative MATE family efflux protein
MLNGNLYKSIIVYALPLMLSGFLQLLFNAADLVVVGKFCGSHMLGAVGACGPLNTLVINFFMGFSIGVSVVVSTGLGEDNWKKVNRAVHTCLPLGLVCGLFVAVFGFIFARPMLAAMDTPDEIIDYAVTYLRITFIGVPGSLIYNYSSAILKANGDTRRPLIYLTISGVLNVILNVIFVVFFDLNIAGVALATAITTVLSGVLTVRQLTRLTNCCRLQFKYVKFYKEDCLRIIKIGLPAGLQQSMFSVSNIIIQSSINSFGTAVMSGSSAAQSINGFQYVLLAGVSQATVNFVGQNYGAQQYDRVRQVRRVSLLYSSLFGLVSAGIIMLFKTQLLGIYITDSKEAIDAGVIKLLFVCTFAFVNGLYDVTAACLRGIGSSNPPAIISIVGICGVRLLIIYTIFQMPEFHNLYVLYAAYPLSWLATLIAGTLVYSSIARKLFTYHDRHMEAFKKDTFKRSLE